MAHVLIISGKDKKCLYGLGRRRGWSYKAKVVGEVLGMLLDVEKIYSCTVVLLQIVAWSSSGLFDLFLPYWL